MIFVANKPSGISSNHFLSRLKRKYGIKKAGFSGTLDPFASGCLIVAFNSHTRFFNYLKKTPKVYEATIWIGAKSESLDNQNIEKIEKLREFHISAVEMIVKNLRGEIEFIPPKFSAKKIEGRRAYDMARKGEEFELKKSKMFVYESEILSYMHPFLKVRLALSQGGYARSWAELFGKKLGVDTTLSALHRVSEGEFKFENEKPLNVFEYLDLDENFYLGNSEDIFLGKKLDIADFKIQNDGKFILNLDKFHSIIEINNGEVKYLMNRIEL